MKIRIGDRVRVCGGSGLDSDKTGTVIPSCSVTTNGRGVPDLVGHYKPISGRESLIQFDDGSVSTMFNDRLIKDKHKHVGNIGCDFVDASGIRLFSFQLCVRTFKGLTSVADVSMNDMVVSRFLAVGYLMPRRKAIERLALIYRTRSTPQVFKASGSMQTQ